MKGEANITETGTTGTSTVTTTYEVNPEDGTLIPTEGQPVEVPATETVVKVPAKDEVKYIKKGNDVVKVLTTYTVNPTNGTLTPTVTEEVVKKGKPLSPELPKKNEDSTEKTDVDVPIEVSEELKGNVESVEKGRNKIDEFTPISSEEELASPVFDYLLIHMIDKIKEEMSNENELRIFKNLELKKTEKLLNNQILENVNDSLLAESESTKVTTQVKNTSTETEKIEVNSTTSVETSTEGKTNSEVANEKVKTEEVKHTETSRNNGILIAEIVAALAGVGFLTTVLKHKKLKD